MTGRYISRFESRVRMSMSLCEETTTQIFLDVDLVHHFINRKLVVQSQYIFKAKPNQPTLYYF
jgi:sucrose-6-phosphate hydrolase SacC (GH32 family)